MVVYQSCYEGTAAEPHIRQERSHSKVEELRPKMSLLR